MNVLDQLRATDERIVPRLAAGLRTGLDRLAGARRPGAPASPLPPAAAAGSGGASRTGPLRRLDDRLTARGPLAVVRDMPQVGALVIGVVLLLGAVLALVRGNDAEPGAPGTDGLGRGAGGMTAQEYRAQARGRLEELAAEGSDRPVPALVSLADRATPEQAAALAEGLDPRRVYLVAQPEPDAAAEVAALDVDDLLPDLEAGYAAEAAATDARVEALRSAAVSIESSRSAERAQAEQVVALAEQQASGWRGRCACAVALVVAAPPARLSELEGDRTVRAVGPAVEEQVPEVDVRLLLPGAPTAVRVPVRAVAL